jgi:hypothetical protein
MGNPWYVRASELNTTLRTENMTRPKRMRADGVNTDGLEKLKSKLLSLGGQTVYAPFEPYLDLLLERGRVFDPKGRRRLKGTLHRCHQNASLYYARHYALDQAGPCDIVTGYGLTAYGLWFDHSWLWDGKHVIETTADAVLYFGVILPPVEAAKFVMSNLMARMPGFMEVTRGVA